MGAGFDREAVGRQPNHLLEPCRDGLLGVFELERNKGIPRAHWMVGHGIAAAIGRSQEWEPADGLTRIKGDGFEECLITGQQAFDGRSGEQVGIVKGPELNALGGVTREESEIEFSTGFMHRHPLDFQPAE